jgi:hypothetical protein
MKDDLALPRAGGGYRQRPAPGEAAREGPGGDDRQYAMASIVYFVYAYVHLPNYRHRDDNMRDSSYERMLSRETGNHRQYALVSFVCDVFCL